ncbi:MAG: GspE/PulE family protein [Candidatus Sumerlaeota bacterium]|nr:GspE/PulE family protein [Candidatus Sumerlaeota bacterium]
MPFLPRMTFAQTPQWKPSILCQHAIILASLVLLALPSPAQTTGSAPIVAQPPAAPAPLPAAPATSGPLSFKEMVNKVGVTYKTSSKSSGMISGITDAASEAWEWASQNPVIKWVLVCIGIYIGYVILRRLYSSFSRQQRIRRAMSNIKGEAGSPPSPLADRFRGLLGIFSVEYLKLWLIDLRNRLASLLHPKKRQRCPQCNKPIDRLEDYETMQFYACPHCGYEITPVYEVEDYVKELMRRIEDAARRRYRGDTEVVLESEAVNKLLRSIVIMGIRRRASDLHVEPGDQSGLVRARVDGVLHDLLEIPRLIMNSFVNHVKILCELDISEKRVPQDGKFDMALDGTNLDVRVNTVPLKYGEKITMRILDARSIQKKLEELGLEGVNLKRIKDSIYEPHGLIVITGPTSSGKTTTLMVALNLLNTGAKNIVTIENPIEYEIKGINQIQVNEAQKFTFATGLRSILRQDPDIIMIGEIRDSETAAIACESAATGHLVFTTLHTNSVIGVFPRLNQLGISPQRYAWALSCMVAQRLARLICPKCKTMYRPDPNELAALNVKNVPDDLALCRGVGCPYCKKTGYYGRMGLFEILRLDASIRKVIETESLNVIYAHARKAGMKILKEEGLVKVSRGLTTIEEIMRVTKE